MVLVLKKIKGLGLDKDGLGLCLEKFTRLVLQVMVLTTSLDSPDVINKLFSGLPEGLRKNFVTKYRHGQGSYKCLRRLTDDAASDAECMLGKQLFNAS